MTKIAIIAQTAYLNVAMKPMEDDVTGTTYWFLFAYYTSRYTLGTILLMTFCGVYLLVINPKYMNRKMAVSKKERKAGS